MAPKLRNEYHDAGLARFQIGPRREVTLYVSLDTVWNPGVEEAVVRFGAIANFEEVKAFLTAIGKSDVQSYPIGCIETIMRLEPRQRGFDLELLYSGAVHIKTEKITEHSA